MKDLESSPKGKFSEIAHNYSQLSSLQQSAGQVLIKKLKIREDEEILNLGCGLGQLTTEEFKIPCQVDVIFCNSSFQWYSDPVQAIKRCYEVLKPGGRVGMQAPAKKRYCPLLLDAFERAVQDHRTPQSFRSFVSPCFFFSNHQKTK